MPPGSCKLGRCLVQVARVGRAALPDDFIVSSSGKGQINTEQLVDRIYLYM